MLFESTRPVSLALQQNKNLSVLSYVEAFWWARVDCASRAGAFLPSGLFGGPMLFESTRPISLALQQNKNLSVLSYVEVFWWARVDVASRAAKNSPPGCFCAIFNDVAAAVRIRPRE